MWLSSFVLLLQEGSEVTYSWRQFVEIFPQYLHSFLYEFGPRQFFTIASFLFCVGFYGVIVRRNAIAVLMATELMLNAVNILFVAFNRWWGMKLTRAAFTSIENVYSPVGQVFAIFVIIIAAAEAAVGIAIVLALYRTRRSANIEDASLMKW